MTSPVSKPTPTSRSISSGTAPPGTVSPAAAVGGSTTRVCLSGADARVHPVERSLPPGYDPLDLVAVLIAGPTAPERSYGLTSAIGEPGTVTDVSVEGGVATVDLDPAIEALATADQLTVITQLVCTLTEQPGVGQVRFTVDGVSVAVIRGDGSSTLDPVSRQDYDVAHRRTDVTPSAAPTNRSRSGR